VRLWPLQQLVVFSLPDDVDRDLARSAVVRAIDLCAPYNEPVAATGHVTATIVVYLASLGTLSVVERRVHYQPMKYRASAKFSTAGKAKVLSTVEIELERAAVKELQPSSASP
jgi:hypothetical protein